MPFLLILLLALATDQKPARRRSSRWPGVIGGLVVIAIGATLGYFICRSL